MPLIDLPTTCYDCLVCRLPAGLKIRSAYFDFIHIASILDGEGWHIPLTLLASRTVKPDTTITHLTIHLSYSTSLLSYTNIWKIRLCGSFHYLRIQLCGEGNCVAILNPSIAFRKEWQYTLYTEVILKKDDLWEVSG
ncbi:hypothetical protein FRC02_005935 [Tulasnella sp. 418]|nr:hypothetical protein FRC02_005935 [Tulasnella sp. 418]